MNYDRIYDMDLVNGDGYRVVLYVTGCNHKCKGCYNKSTWNPRNGKPFTIETKKEIFKLLENPMIDGLTLTGGDPLYEDNKDLILQLCIELKLLYPNKTIWLWTGYTLKECLLDKTRSAIIDLIDVLVDGKYVDELKGDFPYKGSSNQTVYRLKEKI